MAGERQIHNRIARNLGGSLLGEPPGRADDALSKWDLFHQKVSRIPMNTSRGL